MDGVREGLDALLENSEFKNNIKEAECSFLQAALVMDFKTCANLIPVHLNLMYFDFDCGSIYGSS